mgnify:CR=1 FL=1
MQNDFSASVGCFAASICYWSSRPRTLEQGLLEIAVENELNQLEQRQVCRCLLGGKPQSAVGYVLKGIPHSFPH